uniref:Neurotoxin LmNaTx12 n=1 Tax=Lychas mucronatus TaxID=172552 RepID=A0A0U1SJ71_LYCMC|nr:neurotoxin LmNaTx12 precursor [Lychas mucronatus]
MKTLLLVIIALLVIGVQSKDGYPMYKTGREKGCKIACVINDKYCNNDCKLKGGKYGYCYFWKLACYCEGLPDSVEVWTYAKNTCGR